MSCSACTAGHVHEGQPTGSEQLLHSRNTYVALPPNFSESTSKGTIIIIPDGYGWVFVNNRLLADHYAVRTGCKVLLPDFMDGTSFPLWGLEYQGKIDKPSETLNDLFWKPYYMLNLYSKFAVWLYQNDMPKATPKVYDFFRAEKTANPRAPIGAAGFCWGGCLSFILARDKDAPVDVIFTAHPSNLTLPKDVEGLERPMAVAIGDVDAFLGKEKVDVVKKAFTEKEGLEWEVKVYDGCGHGFAIRADPDHETGKQAEEAETQAVEWFNKMLAKVKI